MAEVQLDLLSEQQKACLRLVAQGMTSKEIGKALNLSNMTVDDYILTARTRLGGVNRRQAAQMLVSWESCPPQSVPQLVPQSLGPHPQTIAPGGPPKQIVGAGREERSIEFLYSRLPPIGGRENDLTTPERIVGMGHIGFLAALLLVLTTAIIMGVIALIR